MDTIFSPGGWFNVGVSEPQPREQTGIVPDTKDWTWVLERTCPDCGLSAGDLALSDLPDLLRRSTPLFGEALRRADVAERPDPSTWSVLEYCCHVRDVHVLFAERLRQVLEQDGATFAGWDQDVAAVEGRYGEQSPAAVDVELVEAAGTVAGLYASVTPDQVERRGVRSNGDSFTTLTLGQYHLHDVVHHLHDIGCDVGGLMTGRP